ncbi:type II secretion system F family protein [Mesobacillus harenae]|uniref:type II secretion system F family protein n=1 Tax=Mesobacillus harenae TaxID=2213203 RepID=UPI0015803804|nr:type II secretion system F family protein [Mesobacillus harenae]
MMYLTFFLFISLFSYGLLLSKAEKNQHVEQRMEAFITGRKDGKLPGRDAESHPSLFRRLILPIWSDFKRSFKRRMPGEKEAKLEKKLQMAGSPFGITPVDFRLLQIALLFTLPLAFGGYAWVLGVGAGPKMIFIITGIVVAIVLPNFYLQQKMKTRNHHALRELPDVLDLLTVSLEAGLGFDAAVNKVVSKKGGVIASEFHRCLEEMRLGKTRREALSGIRDRLSVDEVRAFIGSILQAEKLGIGMVLVLRVQSNEVREQRKQRAEEAAMKAPIKMLFPLVLFIFPSLFIVLLGPALIQFIETFQK